MSVNSYSEDYIKKFSLFCEGEVEEIVNLKTVGNSYFFDEFLLTINKKKLNNRTDLIEDKAFLIEFGDDPEIKLERIQSSKGFRRIRSHPLNPEELGEDLSYHMGYWPELAKISISDNSPSNGYASHHTKYTLSLNTGMMTQNILNIGNAYSENMRDWIIKKSVATTRCSGTTDIIAFLEDEATYIDEPSFANKDPNEMISVASGSGFFINKLGNIITNDHVVEGCQVMKLVYDGNEYEAAVIATDKTNDIALLKTEYKNQNYFKISKDDVDRSQNIKAIGYGFGKNYSSDIKVTAGIVNSLSGYNDNYSEFQMDAAIQSGNSGGPVINESGDVVGISVAALDSLAVLEDTGTLPQNVNYAIKASTLKQFLNSKETKYFESNNSWFSFSSMSNKEINDLIDNAAVYLSCYMTYAQIEENMTNKVMFKNLD